jgi:hypothetical protein
LSPASSPIEQLAEHLDAGHHGLGQPDADDLDFFAHLDHAALDAAGHHGAAAGKEHVLDGMRNGYPWAGQAAVWASTASIKASMDLACSSSALGGSSAEALTIESNAFDNKARAPRARPGRAAGVVDHVTLFRYTTSAGTPTWRASRMCRASAHRTVGRRHHEDAAVHLRGTGDRSSHSGVA